MTKGDSILVEYMTGGNFFKLPFYQTPGSAGADIYSAEDFLLEPNKIILVSTGIKLSIPTGYEGQIRSRSGLASKGVIVVNSPGTIDSDYRGEVKVILGNISDKTFHGTKGARIAQIVFQKYIQAIFHQVEQLPVTTRSDGGFGSTGDF